MPLSCVGTCVHSHVCMYVCGVWIPLCMLICMYICGVCAHMCTLTWVYCVVHVCICAFCVVHACACVSSYVCSCVLTCVHVYTHVCDGGKSGGGHLSEDGSGGKHPREGSLRTKPTMIQWPVPPVCATQQLSSQLVPGAQAPEWQERLSCQRNPWWQKRQRLLGTVPLPYLSPSTKRDRGATQSNSRSGSYHALICRKD